MARVELDLEAARRLYVDERLPLSAVAWELQCSPSIIRRRLAAAGIARRGANEPRYVRHDFSGDVAEMAYLIGFRIGDLHVSKRGDVTILVKCTTTRGEQIELFRALFEPYGHVYTDEAHMATRSRQSIAMEARLNVTFDFLLPKQDAVPEWILESDEPFFAFFAGYIDAEGYFRTYFQRGQPRQLAWLEIRSYDYVLLGQLGDGLNARGIPCPPACLRVRAGYTNRYNVRSNRDLWGLGVHRRASLNRLCASINPYLKHPRRRRDMLQVWSISSSQ